MQIYRDLRILWIREGFYLIQGFNLLMGIFNRPLRGAMYWERLRLRKRGSHLSKKEILKPLTNRERSELALQTSYLKLFTLANFLLGLSCVHRIREIDIRDPQIFMRREGQVVMKSPGIANFESINPKVYVERKHIGVRPIEARQPTGSLYNLNRKSNRFYSPFSGLGLGSVVTIHFSPIVRSIGKGENDAADEGEVTRSLDEENGNDIQVPSISMPTVERDSFTNSVRMIVAGQDHDGNLILSYERQSNSLDASKVIRVSAKLPENYIGFGRKFETNMLTDIDFTEFGNSQVFVKKSSSWEDSFTEKLRSFTDVKSILEKEYTSKFNELMDIKEGLANQLTSLGSQRRKVAKEREDGIARLKRSKEKIDALTKEIGEKDEKIRLQAEEIAKKNQELSALSIAEESKREANE